MKAVGLIWRRTGWGQIVGIGALAGVLAAGFSLEAGLRAHYDEGIQALETGQVQLEGANAGIDSYFMVRAMAEQNRQVAATSARLEFWAEVTNQAGATRKVRVRGCSFAQENKVTGLLRRLVARGDYVTSGFVLSKHLSADPQWRNVTRVRLVSEAGVSADLRVSGHVEVPAGSSLDDLSYLDLDTATRLMGASAKVTSIAVRLKKGVDPVGWIGDNRDAFTGLNLVLRPWFAVSEGLRQDPAAVMAPLTVVVDLLMALAEAGILAIVWWSRRPRSGLALLLRTGREHWLSALGATAGAGAAAYLVLLLAAPVYQGWLLAGLWGRYPFVGAPAAVWAWDWSVVLAPLFGLGTGLVLFAGSDLVSRRRVRRVAKGTAGR